MISKKPLHPCILDESSLSMERVKDEWVKKVTTWGAFLLARPFFLMFLLKEFIQDLYLIRLSRKDK